MNPVHLNLVLYSIISCSSRYELNVTQLNCAENYSRKCGEGV